VIMPDGKDMSFHIGPHAPALQAEDVQLVHRLWLNFRRDPDMEGLHHSDIVTYALTRLASDYARDKIETLKNLRRYTQDGRQATPPPAQGSRPESRGGLDYSIRAPRSTSREPGSDHEE